MSKHHRHIIDAGGGGGGTRSPLSYAAEGLGILAAVVIVAYFVGIKLWAYVVKPLVESIRAPVVVVVPPPPPPPSGGEPDDEVIPSDTVVVPPPPPPPPAPDPKAEIKKTAPQLAILVIAIVAFVFWGSSGPLSTSYSGGAGVQYVRNVPYILAEFEYSGGEVAEIPIPDCAYHPQAEWLQQTVLPPVEMDTKSSHAEPSLRKAREEQRQYMLRTRRKALNRCVLRPENMHRLGNSISANEYAPLINEKPFWMLPHDPLLTNASDFRVRHVLFDRRKERYYRVAMVRDGALRPTVVSEQALLDAATEYWTTFKTKPRFGEKVSPFLCASHLNVINSGLVFSLTGENEWQVWINSQIIRDVEGLEVGATKVQFAEHLLAFPGAIDVRFNVTTVSHAESSYVSFTSMETIVESKAGLERIVQAVGDPAWFIRAKGGGGDDDDDDEPTATTPRLAVVPIETADPFPSGSILDGTTNAWVHHCLALDYVSAQVLEKGRRRFELSNK